MTTNNIILNRVSSVFRILKSIAHIQRISTNEMTSPCNEDRHVIKTHCTLRQTKELCPDFNQLKEERVTDELKITFSSSCSSGKAFLFPSNYLIPGRAAIPAMKTTTAVTRTPESHVVVTQEQEMGQPSALVSCLIAAKEC